MKAVVFDIDGTLYPNYKMILHSMPFFFRHPVVVNHFNKIRKQIRKITPIDDFKKLQTRLFADSMGINEARAQKIINDCIYDEWDRIFRNIKIYPGVKECVSAIKGKGLKVGVMSDLPVENKLKNLKVDGLWDFQFTSEDTGYLKPSPEPFLKIIEILGLPAEEILYVGNNYKYDIIGASAVGIKTAHISKKPYKNTRANLTFSCYNTLTKFILDN